MRLFAQAHRQCEHALMKLRDLRLHLALAEHQAGLFDEFRRNTSPCFPANTSCITCFIAAAPSGVAS